MGAKHYHGDKFCIPFRKFRICSLFSCTLPFFWSKWPLWNFDRCQCTRCTRYTRAVAAPALTIPNMHTYFACNLQSTSSCTVWLSALHFSSFWELHPRIAPWSFSVTKKVWLLFRHLQWGRPEKLALPFLVKINDVIGLPPSDLQFSSTFCPRVTGNKVLPP